MAKAKMLGHRMTAEALLAGVTEGTLEIIAGDPKKDTVVEIRYTASGRRWLVLVSRPAR